MNFKLFYIRIKQFFKKFIVFNLILSLRDNYVNFKNVQKIKNNYFNLEINDKITIHIEIQNNIYNLGIRKYPFSDAEVFTQIFIDKCYSYLSEIFHFENYNENKLKIIDAGANVGFSTIYFMSLFDYLDIVVIEPDRLNFKIMRENLDKFKYNFNFDVTFLNRALWINNNQLSITNNFRDFRNASITVDERSNSDFLINGITFSEILRLKNWSFVDIFKMDIEGAERFIFASDSDADFILSRIKVLVIEIHDEFNIRNKIYSHLIRNNFKFFNNNDLTICINEKK